MSNCPDHQDSPDNPQSTSPMSFYTCENSDTDESPQGLESLQDTIVSSPKPHVRNTNSVEIHPFNNLYLERIIHFWNRADSPQNRIQPITMDLFERAVLSKPYFDAQGFLIAEINNSIVGFAHAGFGPDENNMDIDYSQGSIAMICYDSSLPQCTEIIDLLIAACETYLLQKGARHISVGAFYPMAPFYLAMTTTSDLTGIYMNDYPVIEAALKRDYCLQNLTIHYRCNLIQHDWPVTLKTRQLRRKFNLICGNSPTPVNWWNAVAMTPLRWSFYSLATPDPNDKNHEILVAACSTWNLSSQSSIGCDLSIGMTHLYISPEFRHSEAAQFMLTELLRHFKNEEYHDIQLQIAASYEKALVLFEELGFRPIQRSAVYVKDF